MKYSSLSNFSRYVLLILLISSCQHLHCQEKKDLNNGLAHPKIQELKKYIKWSSNYASQKLYDSAARYVKRSELLAKEINDPMVDGMVRLNTAKILYWRTETEKAKDLLFENINSSILQDTNKIRSYFLLGEIFKYERNYNQALSSFIEVIEVSKLINPLGRKDSLRIASANASIGSLQKTAGNFNEALTYYNKAVDYSKNTEYQSYYLSEISKILNEKNDMSSALQYGHKALKLGVKNDEKVFLPSLNLYLSDYHLKLNNSDSTIFYGQQGLVNNIDCHLDLLNINLGKAYLMEQKYVNSLSYFNEALLTSTNVESKLEVHKNLREAYIKMGQFEKAIEHNEEFLKLNDSLSTLRIKQELLDITQKYEADKKELKIGMLNAENEHNNLIIVKQKNQLILVSLLLILSLTLISLISYFYTKQKKQRQILFKRNLQLAKDLKNIGINTSYDLAPVKKSSKNEKSTIDDLTKSDIRLAIHDLIEERFYLNSDITLVKMAKAINTNTSYLSKIINEDLKKSFTNFINELRIEHTLKSLETEPDHRNLTIEHIAEIAGFSSSSTFYTAFKKFTGLTPSYYIKCRLKQE